MQLLSKRREEYVSEDDSKNDYIIYSLIYFESFEDVKVNHDMPGYYPPTRAIRINLIHMDYNDPNCMFHHHNFEIVVLSKNYYDSQLLYY